MKKSSKSRNLVFIPIICLLMLMPGFVKAQSVHFDGLRVPASLAPSFYFNYIYSDLSNRMVVYGFRMTVSNAPVTINNLNISATIVNAATVENNVDINLNDLFKEAKLIRATGTGVHYSSIDTGAVSEGVVTLGLNNASVAVNQTYNPGTYYFYLSLKVDRDKFVAARNGIKSSITQSVNNPSATPLLVFTLPNTPATTTGTVAQTVTQKPPLTGTGDLFYRSAKKLAGRTEFYYLGWNYRWTGTQSTVWSDYRNWAFTNGVAATDPPGEYDRCSIGDGVPMGNIPTINTSTTTFNYPGNVYLIGNLSFGPIAGLRLRIDAGATLRLTNALIQKSASTAAGTNTLLDGFGTLVAAGNFQVGDGSTPNPTESRVTQVRIRCYLNVYNTILTSQTNRTNTSLRNNAQLILQRSELITQSLQTLNDNLSTSTFEITPSEALTPVLKISGSNFLTGVNEIQTLAPDGVTINTLLRSYLSPNGTNVIRLNNPNSTVQYMGDVAQQVYTDADIRDFVDPSKISLAGGVTYNNIRFYGRSVKTVQPGNFVVNGNWESYGNPTSTFTGRDVGRIDLITNNPTVIFNGNNQTFTDFGSDDDRGVTFHHVSFTGGSKNLAGGNFNVRPGGILSISGNSSLTVNTTPPPPPSDPNNRNAQTPALILKSDATGSASVNAIPAGSSIVGNVNVERFITGGSGNRGYRMLSVPVNISSAFNNGNIALDYVSNNALTGGPGGTANGFTLANNNPTMYAFLETEIAPTNATFNSGKYKGITRLGTNNVDIFGFGTRTLPIGTGYILFFIGNNTNTNTATTRIPENVTLTARGYLNQGDIIANSWITGSSNLSYTPASGLNAGLNLVGNPYASTISLDRLIDDNPKIKKEVHLLYKNTYVTYSPLGGSAPINPKYVSSGQGFIVQAIDNNSTLTFKESHKVPAQQNTGANLLMGTPEGQAQSLITGFYMKMEMDSLNFDYCGIYFREDWVTEYDENDAIDIDGTSPKVFISSYSSDGVRTSINRYPDYKNSEAIKLYVNATAGGTYHLKIEDIRNMDSNFDIWLKDYYLKDSVNLREHPDYTFNIDKTIPASFGGERFELFAKLKPLPPYELLSFTGEQVNEGIALKWTVKNEARYTDFVLEKQNSAGLEFSAIYTIKADSSGNYVFIDKLPEIGDNIYRLKQVYPINAETSAEKYSDTITVNYQLRKPQNKKFAIYPNPAVNDITIDMVEIPTSPLIMHIIDNKGNILSKKTINGQSTQHQVGHLSAGSYLIKISDNKTNEVVAIGKLIKL